jgi:hypothetical protein
MRPALRCVMTDAVRPISSVTGAFFVLLRSIIGVTSASLLRSALQARCGSMMQSCYRDVVPCQRQRAVGHRTGRSIEDHDPG